VDAKWLPFKFGVCTDIFHSQHGIKITRSILSLYGSTVLLLDLGRFLNSLILYTVGRTPLTGDEPVARPLLARRTT
jgi:hypothetical protein